MQAAVFLWDVAVRLLDFFFFFLTKIKLQIILLNAEQQQIQILLNKSAEVQVLKTKCTLKG